MNTDRDVHIDITQLGALAGTRGRSLDITGAATLRDVSCRDLHWEDSAFRGEQSYWRSGVLRLRGRSAEPTLLRCDFSGLRTRGLVAHAGVEQSLFHDVDVKVSPAGTQGWR